MSPAEVRELHPAVTDQAIAFVSLGLRALGERAFRWATLLLVSAMWFAVALAVEPTYSRLVAAVLFSAFVIIFASKETTHGTARPQVQDA